MKRMKNKRSLLNLKRIFLFFNFFCLAFCSEISSFKNLKDSKRYLMSTRYTNSDINSFEKQSFNSNDLKSDPFLRPRSNDKLGFAKQEVDYKRKKNLNLFNKWKLGKYEGRKNNPAEKESEIAQIFFGVAYGTPSMQTVPTTETSGELKDAQKIRSVKKYFSLIRPTNTLYQHNYFHTINDRESNSRNSYLVQESKARKENSNIFKEHSQNLIQEINSIKLNFSLPQLFISTEEMNSNEHTNLPHSTMSALLEENLSNVYKGREKPSSKERNVDLTMIDDNELYLNETKQMNFSFFPKSDNYWILTRTHYSTAWAYHDHIALILFSLLSLFPLILLSKIHYIKRDHITPRYCTLLTFYLLTVCCSRIVLYSVDPYATKGRISFMVVSFLDFKVQSLLICSVGIFLVILIFPIYRPKSQLLPRLITGFLIIILISKFILYLICIIQNKNELFLYIKPFICIFNLSEIGFLAIFYIFLNLCTRQKHKIWWIRAYKKTLTTSTNYSFSVLYSKLRKSIRLGSFAVFVQLINSTLCFIIEFNLRDIFSSYQADAWMIWVEESFKRIFEGSVCVALILGVNLLFVPKIRSVIKKRSSFKTFTDIIKGRRRRRNKELVGKVKQNLSIFTLNKQKKTTDYATSDFQLVWNQNRNFPMSTISDGNTQKSTKSLDFAESSLIMNEKKQEVKLSQSVDILSNINDNKSDIPFGFYDNIQHRPNRIPLYQNQYFHYDCVVPKIHDPNICSSVNGKYIYNKAENRKKGKKNLRPKSYAEERPKINENYLTSYFSILSMDRFFDGDLKDYTRQVEGPIPVERKPLPHSIEEINSPMISNEKWKDIKITQKFCTIKINPKNSRKKLSTSKSIDLF